MCLPAKLAGVAAKNFAKVGYVVFQISMFVLTIIMMYIWKWIADSDAADWFGFGCSDIGGGACAGASALVRMSFIMAIFHVLILCITFARNECAAVIHDGYWGFKFLLVLGGFIGSLWIPNDPVMEGYMVFSKWISVIFLIY